MTCKSATTRHAATQLLPPSASCKPDASDPFAPIPVPALAAVAGGVAQLDFDSYTNYTASAGYGPYNSKAIRSQIQPLRPRARSSVRR